MLENTIKDKPIADIFFKGYYDKDSHFEIAMRNSEWVSQSKNLNAIILENKILRALSILVYAPI
jgi:hypothetical protein